MFIDIQYTYKEHIYLIKLLSASITSSRRLLAAGVDDVLPGDVVEDLLDGPDERVLGVMRGPIGVSLSQTHS